MHGEYRPPGGQQVVVDADEVDGRFANLHFSGDFLPPVGAVLESVVGVLEGLEVTSSVKEMTAVVEAALAARGEVPAGLVDAQAVAIAVRRAASGALSWSDIDFEIIHGPVLDPVLNVALDETLVEEVMAGRRKPFLRLWEWDAPQVVIGSFQSVANEIQPEGAARQGITVTRRISGGGAMFMQPGMAITWSLVVPTALVEGMSFEQSYPYLDQWVMEALASIGVRATYVPLNDIASDKGKIAGAAQKRWAKGWTLHHVTMSYDIDTPAMVEVLRIGMDKLRDKGTRSAAKWVDPLVSQISLSRDEVVAAFADHFIASYGATWSELSSAELETARRRCESKFATPEWTYRLP